MFHNFVLVFGFRFIGVFVCSFVCLLSSEESKINMTFRRNNKKKHGLSYHVDTKAYLKAVLTKRYVSALYKVGLDRRPLANGRKPTEIFFFFLETWLSG